MLFDHRSKMIVTIILIAVITVFNFAPIPQDPDYHRFADQRGLMGIAYFVNVISNLPFVLVGIMGMRLIRDRCEGCWRQTHLMLPYFIFFLGVFLTGIGSSYYHSHPDNKTLLWDRLPMTVAFMAFFSAIVGEYISTRWALKMLVPLLMLGLFSVLYWQMTERNGQGDLRLYALVQFLPILLMPVILWLYKPAVDMNNAVWGLMAAYAVSKIAEFYDAGLYNAVGFISGHSIKHMLAAFGAFIIYRALRDRKGGLEGQQ